MRCSMQQPQQCSSAASHLVSPAVETGTPHLELQNSSSALDRFSICRKCSRHQADWM
jgi:hypothetical protein